MIELEYERRYLIQWELNRRVILYGFKTGTRVDFSMLYDCKDSALMVKSYEEDGIVYADIPNILLQKFGVLRVFVATSASDVEHTPEQKDIKIVRREKPSDYVYTETKTISYEELAGRIEDLEEKLDQDPQTAPKMVTIYLPASGWTSSGGTVYSQRVDIDEVTEKSKVDPLPSPEQLEKLLTAEISMMTANDNGTVTVFAIGGAPADDYTMQAIVTEVSA